MDDTNSYKVGDQVQLKSGGPTMTVMQIMNSGLSVDRFRCSWFSGKKLSSGFFEPESLQSVPSDE